MPDQRPLLDHQPAVTTPAGKWGGPDYSFRGAVIHSNPQGGQFGFRLDGYPRGGASGLGSLDLAVRLIGYWLDHGRLPTPYRQKG